MQPDSDEGESASKVSLDVGVDPTVFCLGHGGFFDPLERRRHLSSLGLVEWLGSHGDDFFSVGKIATRVYRPHSVRKPLHLAFGRARAA
jgi:hypothetical protein